MTDASMTRLRDAPYHEEIARRPSRGRHLLAQHDEATVTVYQAYRPSIAEHAVAHQRFGGDFDFGRMSWIKPSFLWMMFRCGWGTKKDQERVLAIRIHRPYFDGLLARVVPSAWDRSVHATREEWTLASRGCDIRMQWDPDHAPGGAPIERRTIQLGLRGAALAGFAGDAIDSIEDVTPFVVAQREHRSDPERLAIPIEEAYPVTHPLVRTRLALSQP
jgi:hypothetical protein